MRLLKCLFSAGLDSLALTMTKIMDAWTVLDPNGGG